MPLKRIVLFCLLWLPFLGRAQDVSAILAYIDSYKELAITEMKRTGVPASIKLAQGIHETMAGTSPLVIKSNNHFGIKCKTGWSGPSVKHDDDARNECFRKYESPNDSYRDHSNFLKGSPRYAGLFNLDPIDYEGWAWGLKKAGYATNPKYAQTLVKLIEEYGLQQYSLIALGRQQPDSESMETEIADVEPTQTNADAANPEVAKPEAVQPATNKITVAQAEIKQEATAKTEERYPSGVFRQNGIRAIYVPAGTPYLAIANQGKIPLSRLFEYNEISPSTEATTDRVLFLEKPTKNRFHLPSLNKKAH